LAGRNIECSWQGWGIKCRACAQGKHGRCSFEESPEEQLDHAEAAFTHGQDSLTCKLISQAFLLAHTITDFASFYLDLRSLLARISDFRNMGNANAALAQANFNQQDRFVDEFLHRIFCLAGEDAPTSLIDSYFNEELTLRMLDEVVSSLPLPNNDIPPPAQMAALFRELLNSVQAVWDKDSTACALVQHEHAAPPSRAPSPPVTVPEENDDMYVDDAQDDHAREDAKVDTSDNEPLVDVKAQHVPPGEESPNVSTESDEESGESNSSSSGSSDGEDSS
jgi:hypothetical protein